MSIATRRDLLNLQQERNPNIIGATKNIWLAADRTSGGTGSLDSPYSANTQAKLDAIWAANQGTGINFFYLPGTYSTNGWQYRSRNTARPYQRHYGYGMFNTEIKLVNASAETTDGSVFGMDYDYTADGFGVFDMTVNANGMNLPKRTSNLGIATCINGIGNHFRTERVRCIGFGSFQVTKECFPLNWSPGVGQHARHWEDNWVRDCRFESTTTGNADGCSICALHGSYLENTDFGDGIHTYSNNGIENCYFSDFSAAGFLYVNGTGGLLVRDCVFHEGMVGIYNEPAQPAGQVQDLLYEGNTFFVSGYDNACRVLTVADGLNLIQNITFRNNKIWFTGDKGSGFVVANGFHDPGGILYEGTISNLIIQDNEFRTVRDVELDDANACAIRLACVTNGLIMNNIFSMEGEDVDPIWTDGTRNTNLTFKQNYNIDGSLATVRTVSGDSWTNTE